MRLNIAGMTQEERTYRVRSKEQHESDEARRKGDGWAR
jgi:hypothetical protein